MRAVVIGGNGGIGSAFVDHLVSRTGRSVVATHHRRGVPEGLHDRDLEWCQLDASDEQQVEAFCRHLGDVELFINAVGMLHDAEHGPEKSTRQIDSDHFLRSISLNTLPTLLFAKHLVKNLRHGQTAVFATVSARVGSIGENCLGGWYSYRASKAALNQVLKTLAIEWRRNLPNVCVAALHPGTTDTPLSAPFQKNVPQGQLFSPQQSVGYMMQVLERLTPQQSGRFWSFDGEILPW